MSDAQARRDREREHVVEFMNDYIDRNRMVRLFQDEIDQLSTSELYQLLGKIMVDHKYGE